MKKKITTIHGLKNIVGNDFKGTTESLDKQRKSPENQIFYRWEKSFIKRIDAKTNGRKKFGNLDDAINQSYGLRNKKDDVFIEYYKFINSGALHKNDFYKYVTSYLKGKKLLDKYFKYDLSLLRELYKKIDKKDDYACFSEKQWKDYVLYMMLKFNGLYTKSMDSVFGVKKIQNREYNPLTSISKHLRHILPPSLNLKVYDISRANPSFIDLELGIKNREEDVYSLMNKVKFNTLINAHKDIKNMTIESVRSQLKPIYLDRVDEVITEERFNNKGKMFEDLSKYEDEFIAKFITENKITHYVRLHDAVFVLVNSDISNLEFGSIKFKPDSLKAPEIINNRITFYSHGSDGKIQTSPYGYKTFLEQEGFLRVTIENDDQVHVIKSNNNIAVYFNHKTDTLPFLAENINEFDTSKIENHIAKDVRNVIPEAYILIPPKPFKYYRDTATTFGLLFRNGFFALNQDSDFVDKTPIENVDGFFAPHYTQQRDFKFEYKPEMSIFQRFLTLVAVKKDPLKDVLTEGETENADSFCRMFGYLCHSYKNPTFNPAIILSDQGANDESRNGGRGKSLVLKAVEQVQKIKIKGGNEFDPNYRHRFADLRPEHKVFVIDDAPAAFKYDDLYTNISGDILTEHKGKQAETIPFEESPKFAITTNWNVKYDPEATSTNRRFIEFQLTDFFNAANTPDTYFKQHLFKDWDDNEWNNFYNFVFCSVKNYLLNGLSKPAYDKKSDNYRAVFYNDVIRTEFERIFEQVSVNDDGFKVSDFLTIYNDPNNALRTEKLFTHRNTKKFIETHISFFKLKFHYSQSLRKWLPLTN